MVFELFCHLKNNADKIRYDDYRRQGLPIMTSAVESVLNMMNKRVKRSRSSGQNRAPRLFSNCARITVRSFSARKSRAVSVDPGKDQRRQECNSRSCPSCLLSRGRERHCKCSGQVVGLAQGVLATQGAQSRVPQRGLQVRADASGSYLRPFTRAL
jgi:hypothetical protein